jgi:hypothetical protein
MMIDPATKRIELQDALLYTKAAIARLLGVRESKIVRTMVWWSGFWILIKGQSPRLYKKSIFKQHFPDSRRQQSQGLSVHFHGKGKYTVKGSRAHEVFESVASKEYICDCRDHQSIVAAFGKGACKHIYAVLGYQGFAKLSDRWVADDRANYGKAEARAIGL